MAPTTLRMMFGLACLCTLGAGALLLLEPPGSAPFWITVWTLVIALAFLATVVWMVRTAVRPTGRKGGGVSSRMARQASPKSYSFSDNESHLKE